MCQLSFTDIIEAFLRTMNPAERAAAYAEASRFIRETEGILMPNEASEMFWNTYMGFAEFRRTYRPQATSAALACDGGQTEKRVKVTRKLITIGRYWSDAIGTDDDHTPGWICWVRVFPDGENDGLPSDEALFNLKKDALAWAKKNHPGAKISYVTDCQRKRALDGAGGR